MHKYKKTHPNELKIPCFYVGEKGFRHGLYPVLAKVLCDRYQVQPSEFIEWVDREVGV